jgi:hypothetical protein
VILFIVRPRKTPAQFLPPATRDRRSMNVVVFAADREMAKLMASPKLRGLGFADSDTWDVIPLTADGDQVFIDIDLSH